MNCELRQALVNGSNGISVTISAADLREVIAEMMHNEQKRINEAIERNREKPTMTRHQAAEALNVSLCTLDRWAKEGYITPVKLGVKVLYKPSEIDAMIHRNQAI